jgi:hypothetical protein
MRIYFAGIEPHSLTMGRNILLSYYDLTMSPFSFRKETWEILRRYLKSGRGELTMTETKRRRDALTGKTGRDDEK